MSFGVRFGLLMVAAALLFAAHKLFKARGTGKTFVNYAGLFVAFSAGAMLLGTFVGGWVRTAAGWGMFGVAGLIVCAVIVLVDCLIDRKPDMPAFVAVFLLPLFVVFGVSQIPTATDGVKSGVSQVGDQMGNIGSQTGGKPAPGK